MAEGGSAQDGNAARENPIADIRRDDGRIVVSLAGELDLYNAHEVRDALLRSAEVLRVKIGGRLGRAVALFGRGGLAALEALESAGWDVFTRRPKPSRARLAREAALVLVR